MMRSSRSKKMKTIMAQFFRDVWRKLCLVALKNFILTLPEHVVFVVNDVHKFYDRPRTFAADEYERKFENILQCAEWCLELGIAEISVYVFNPAIFKSRPEEEEKIMTTFCAVIKEWIRDCEGHNNTSILSRNSVRINIFDDANTPHSNTVLSVGEKLMQLTEMNTEIVVNIVIGYLSTSAVVNKIEEFSSATNQPSREEFKRSLYKYHLHEPQLVISNCMHGRLTDYLVWKIPRRCIQHVHVMWHEFSWWHFALSLLYFWKHQTKKKVDDTP